MKRYYMHTIDGQPGFFDCIQVCYAARYGAKRHNVLVPNLRQIKREQEASISFRRERGYGIGEHDYIIVYAPEAE